MRALTLSVPLFAALSVYVPRQLQPASGAELRFRVDIIQCCAGIKSCGQAGQWQHSLQLMGDALQDSLHRLEVAWAATTRACNTWEQAVHLACTMDQEFVQSAAMSACVRESSWSNAIEIFASNAHATYSLVMYNAVLAVAEWSQALQMLEDMSQGHLRADVVTYGAVMASCQKQWVLEILDELQQMQVRKNSFIYNIAITACDKSSHGAHWESALILCRELQDMNMDDLFTYNASISACGNAKQWKCALSLIPVLGDQRLKPQLITYNTVISACENQWWIVKGILEEVDKLALERDVITFNTSIKACGSCAEWQEALHLFREVRVLSMEANEVTYTAVMGVCGMSGEWQRVLELLMQCDQIGFVDTTMSSVALSACSSALKWQKGLELFEDAKKKQLVETWLFFDGVCNLCDGFVNFVYAGDSQGRVRFGALQKHSELLERHGAARYAEGGEEGMSTVVVIQDGQVFVRSSAALRVLAVMDQPWRMLAVFYLVPLPLRDFVYRLVGQHRYAMFGRKEQCMTPSGDFKRRFLEYDPSEEEPHPIFG
eukprot:symbB.v1.2.003399.t1/scaffold190.1/size276550/24